MKLRRILLALIVLIYCSLSVLYAILTPPWESPDEPAHYLYISELAGRWRPPLKSNIIQTRRFSQDQAYISSDYEWFQPVLGYLPGAIVYKIIETIAPDILPQQIPQLSYLAPEIPSKYNIFVDPGPGIVQRWDGAWGLLIIRLILSLLGLPVIFAIYLLCNLLDNKGGFLGIVAAAWVAFLPQFTFANANVRSDTLTNAIAAFAFLVAVLMQTSTKNKNKYALSMGILLGLGVLCKHTFIYIVPIGFIAVILINPKEPRALLKPMIFYLVPIIVLVGGYYAVYEEARVALLYTVNTTLQLRPNALTWNYISRIPVPLLIDYFYARFGWANVGPDYLWGKLAFWGWVIGTCVTLIQIFRIIRQPQASQSIKIITILTAGWLLAFVGVIRYNLSNFSPQGRYLFPALVPYAILAFWGPWQIIPKRAKIIIGITVIGFMLIFNLYSIFFTLLPAYS